MKIVQAKGIWKRNDVRFVERAVVIGRRPIKNGGFKERVGEPLAEHAVFYDYIQFKQSIKVEH